MSSSMALTLQADQYIVQVRNDITVGGVGTADVLSVLVS